MKAPDSPAKYYSMAEASQMTGVPAYTIRRWQEKVPHTLAPERTPGGQRRYTLACIETVRLLDHWVNGRGMSLAGAARAIEQQRDAEKLDITLTQRVLSDHRVQRAIDDLAVHVRRVILEEMAEEPE